MTTLRRFFNQLQTRLILTHMVVAVTVLIVAAMILLILQAPLRQENMVQRMTEWLQPTITLARSNFADALTEGNNETSTRFLDYLRSQADAQNARILLVMQPQATIIFDTEGRLVDATWTPGARREFNFSPRRMRSGAIMPMMVAATRGAVHLDNDDWYYVATMLLPLHDGSLEMVVLKPQPGLLRSMWESITELPRGVLIGGLLTLALAVFLLSRWTAGAVTQSLAPLMEGTRALAEGNLAYRVDASHVSLNEVHALAASFNQMADRVQQSQRAQRDFIANVSHDLKTPLTSIQGFSQALLDGTAAGPEMQQRAALIISQEAQRLTNLVEEVIDLARLEDGRLQLHLQRLDPNEIGAEVAESLAPRYEASGVRLVWMPAPTISALLADAARLRRALTNLLDNALEHTPPGGEVTLAVASVGEGAQVRFSVTDAGDGIPPAELERIWERFYRVDRARTHRNGSGLGLAIVKEIVEAHGGTVGVDSTVGQGSRFWFTLPANGGNRAVA
ncbi:MAG TPA: HAMP domain-containing protein [Chloroflexi bacterium]|nr:HAMP domain-containing protein [Chloroflexota bacterium]